jgi:hypothetical protein
MEKKKLKKKGLVVSEKEHAQWHKENGSCGTGKEHDACMKKYGITIRKSK